MNGDWTSLGYQDGDASDKFYDVYEVGTVVLLNWGRRGAVGQVKIDTYPTTIAAHNAATRQVNAKLSKGYHRVDQELKVDFPQGALYGQGDVAALRNALTRHRRNSGVAQVADPQETALNRYASLISEAHSVMGAAMETRAPSAVLLTRWEHLSQAWKELNDQHEELQILMGLAEQTIGQRVTGA